jgi:hypothetical protein
MRIGEDLKAKRKTTEPKMFHIYSDYIAVRNTFMQNKQMPVVGMRDGTLGVTFGVNNDGNFSLVPRLLESFEFKQMGLSYFEVVPNYEGIVHDVKKNELKRYCISLPELTLTGIPPVRGKSFFTFINSDWERIMEDKTFHI